MNCSSVAIHLQVRERTNRQIKKGVFLALLFRFSASCAAVMECLGSAEGLQGGSGQAADCHNRPLTNKTEENRLHF